MGVVCGVCGGLVGVVWETLCGGVFGWRGVEGGAAAAHLFDSLLCGLVGYGCGVWSSRSIPAPGENSSLSPLQPLAVSQEIRLAGLFNRYWFVLVTFPLPSKCIQVEENEWRIFQSKAEQRRCSPATPSKHNFSWYADCHLLAQNLIISI